MTGPFSGVLIFQFKTSCIKLDLTPAKFTPLSVNQTNTTFAMRSVDEFILIQRDFRQGERLGSHVGGDLYKVSNIKDAGEVHVKRVTFERNTADQKYFMEEIDLFMLMIPHPLIAKFYGLTLVPERAIYTEFVDGPSLFRIFEDVGMGNPPKEWTSTLKAKTVFGIAAGMMHLRAQNILHRRLKPSNIMFDRLWDVRIVDFGFARKVAQDEDVSAITGNAWLMAPETIDVDPDMRFNPEEQAKVDVFAFAMILYQIITGLKPFRELKSDQSIKRAIIDGRRPQGLATFPGLMSDICRACWEQEPQNRPEFYHVVDSLLNATEQLFPGVKMDEFDEFRQRIFDVTLQSFEAEELFNAPKTDDATVRAFSAKLAAADRGDPAMQVAVARGYAEGVEVQQDFNTAFRYFRMAADVGHAMGKFYTAYFMLRGRGCEKNAPEGARLMKESADGGNATAMFEYARILKDGLGVEKDETQARLMFKLLADKNMSDAQQWYARLCETGVGGERDIAESARYYEMAHQAGNNDASTAYAVLTITNNLDGDPTQGVQILRRAAKRGSIQAAASLGILYNNPSTIPDLVGKIERDFNESVAYLERAVKGDNIQAQFLVADCCKDGKEGFGKNEIRARTLYRSVADCDPGNDAKAMKVKRCAQVNFALMCWDGAGGAVDKNTAYAYVRQAALAQSPYGTRKMAEWALSDTDEDEMDRDRVNFAEIRHLLVQYGGDDGIVFLDRIEEDRQVGLH